MRQVGKVSADRMGGAHSVVTIDLRTPEAAKALHGGARLLYLLTFAIVTAILSRLAYLGMFGDTVFGFIQLTIVLALVHWVIHGCATVWQERSRFVSDRAVVHLAPHGVRIERSTGQPVTLSGSAEIRFSSRPHWLGREEERDERRVNHPIGYEYRDAWEVWCEAGLEVVRVAAVSREDDARAIVRLLTEEYLFVTRGIDADEFHPHRAEPA